MKSKAFTQWVPPQAAVPSANLTEPVGSARRAAPAASRQRKLLARRGLSDRALAWLFVGPTILLLLAFNIFPLLWTIYLSFTNFRANRPNAEVT
ncbi:MAG TPA: hypothetical protein VGQ71_10995, partial [Terriglobales bacterium]|nr:hypothetical protein [Terriglobales bacterium]